MTARYSIFLGMGDERTGLCVELSGDGYVGVAFSSPSRFELLYPRTPTYAIRTGRGAANVVEVIVEGRMLELHVNEEQLCRIPVPRSPTGPVGIQTSDSGLELLVDELVLCTTKNGGGR